MTAPTPPERRQAPRVADRVSLAISDTSFAAETESQNLSATGVYCTLDRFIPPMTKLQVRFEVPNGARRVPIACAGVVVRVEPVIDEAQRGRYHVAIYFTDITDRNRSAISTFVAQRLSAQT